MPLPVVLQDKRHRPGAARKRLKTRGFAVATALIEQPEDPHARASFGTFM